MTNEELIKGMTCIRYMIESLKESMPTQTENQLKVIDEVIAKLQTEDKGV